MVGDVNNHNGVGTEGSVLQLGCKPKELADILNTPSSAQQNLMTNITPAVLATQHKPKQSTEK